MRDFLKELELEKDVIEKIMAEYGKNTGKDKEKIATLEAKNQELEGTVTDYEGKINDLSSKSSDAQKIKKELDDLKKSIAEENEAKENKRKDDLLTSNVLTAVEGKEFVNEYTKNSIVSEIKTKLKEEGNVKSAKEIFEDLTSGKDGILKTQNQVVNMTPVSDINDASMEMTKEEFDKMTYLKRVELKQNNPSLFEKLNK